MLAKYERIEELEEEVRQLKERLAEMEGQQWHPAARRLFGATNKQAAFICLLAKRGDVTRSVCIDTVYAMSNYAGIDDGYQAISALTKQCRKHLRRFGMEVQTVYGRGWRISQETQAQLRQLIIAECA